METKHYVPPQPERLCLVSTDLSDQGIYTAKQEQD